VQKVLFLSGRNQFQYHWVLFPLVLQSSRQQGHRNHLGCTLRKPCHHGDTKGQWSISTPAGRKATHKSGTLLQESKYASNEHQLSTRSPDHRVINDIVADCMPSTTIGSVSKQMPMYSRLSREVACGHLVPATWFSIQDNITTEQKGWCIPRCSCQKQGQQVVTTCCEQLVA